MPREEDMIDAKKALTELEIAELEEELQRIFKEDPEAFEEVFGPKQWFDSNTRPWDIFETKSGGWSVVLSVEGGPDGRVRMVGPFGTKEDALAFVAEHAPRND